MAGKPNERADVWRNPVGPSTDFSDEGAKADVEIVDDWVMNHINVNNAHVVNQMGCEDNR